METHAFAPGRYPGDLHGVVLDGEEGGVLQQELPQTRLWGEGRYLYDVRNSRRDRGREHDTRSLVYKGWLIRDAFQRLLYLLEILRD